MATMTKNNLRQEVNYLTQLIQNDTELLQPQYGPDDMLVPRVFNIVKDGNEGLVSVELWDDPVRLYRLEFRIEGKYTGIDMRTVTDSLDNLKINQLRQIKPLLSALVYGRVSEVKDSDVIKCENDRYTLLTARVEAGMFDLVPVLKRFNELNDIGDGIVYLKSYNESSSVLSSSTAEIWLDESKMDLIQLKKELFKTGVREKQDIHIITQSLDYGQYDRLRDRKSPYPKEMN